MVDEINKSNFINESIIIDDIYYLLIKLFLLITILIYPIICMFYNKDEIIEGIKEMWYTERWQKSKKDFRA